MTDGSQACPRRPEGGAPKRSEHDGWATGRWDDERSEIRACPYCGCVHVEDAIELIGQGWRIDPSVEIGRWDLRCAGKDSGLPVKLYGQHATQEQIVFLHSLLAKQCK